jgi:hypothetical protein
MRVKGYKAMNPDMTCRGFKFEVGKEYKTDCIKLCEKGFQFCENFFDVYNYYPKTSDTVVCEIEAIEGIFKQGDKSVCSVIKIIRKLSDSELLEFWIKKNNSGDGNSGNWNSGDWNSGNWNSGNWNSGNRNSGDWNSGYGNSGNWNSGNWNSGYGNSGNWNSGYGNSGNWNSGDWNSGNWNSGYFNTKVPLYLFNKPTDMQYTYEFANRIRSINVKPIVEWVGSSLMTEQEKNDFPSHKVTGGFLRKTARHDWRFLTEDDKKFIKSLPGYDDEIFKVISNGVSLIDEIEITVNGVTKYISKEKAKELGLI